MRSYLPLIFFAGIFLASCSRTSDVYPTLTPKPEMTQGITATTIPLPTPSSTLIPATPTAHETEVPREPPTATETVLQASISPTKALDVVTQAIIIDHTSIALFVKIPVTYLTAASEMNMVFSNRSVGKYNESLDCLSAPSWDRSLLLADEIITMQSGIGKHSGGWIVLADWFFTHSI